MPVGMVVEEGDEIGKKTGGKGGCCERWFLARFQLAVFRGRGKERSESQLREGAVVLGKMKGKGGNVWGGKFPTEERRAESSWFWVKKIEPWWSG